MTSLIHGLLVIIDLENIILWDRMSALEEKLQVYMRLGIRPRGLEPNFHLFVTVFVQFPKSPLVLA